MERVQTTDYVFFVVGGSNKGILAQFISYLSKRAVFRNVTKLKGKITIVNDLSKEDFEKQKIFFKHSWEARKNNQKATLKGLELEIDDHIYTLQDLEKTEIGNEPCTDSEKELKREQ